MCCGPTPRFAAPSPRADRRAAGDALELVQPGTDEGRAHAILRVVDDPQHLAGVEAVGLAAVGLHGRVGPAAELWLVAVEHPDRPWASRADLHRDRPGGWGYPDGRRFRA